MLEEKTQELMVNMQAVLPLIVTNALSALGAIVILLIGLWLSGKADQLVVRVLSRTPHFDPTLKSFFGSLARYLILTVTLLAVLSQFGIQTTSLVAVIGAASLAVGLALQGTLSNLAAGIMLLIFRPFRVGHKVQVGGSLGHECNLATRSVAPDDQSAPWSASGDRPASRLEPRGRSGHGAAENPAGAVALWTAPALPSLAPAPGRASLRARHRGSRSRSARRRGAALPASSRRGDPS
jgi:hypothetical protein